MGYALRTESFFLFFKFLYKVKTRCVYHLLSPSPLHSSSILPHPLSHFVSALTKQRGESWVATGRADFLAHCCNLPLRFVAHRNVRIDQCCTHTRAVHLDQEIQNRCPRDCTCGDFHTFDACNRAKRCRCINSECCSHSLYLLGYIVRVGQRHGSWKPGRLTLHPCTQWVVLRIDTHARG